MKFFYKIINGSKICLNCKNDLSKSIHNPHCKLGILRRYKRRDKYSKIHEEKD